jgi:hypothetical protein
MPYQSFLKRDVRRRQREALELGTNCSIGN